MYKMKYPTLLSISILFSLCVTAQFPKGLPSPFSTGFAQYGYLKADSGLINVRDTTFRPSKVGMMVMQPNTMINYTWTGTSWVNASAQGLMFPDLSYLRNYKAPSGTIVNIQGNSQWFDGGGGQFVYIAGVGTDTVSGNVIQPISGQTGRWFRKGFIDGATLNVRWFGVKGDGVSDDYASMNYALQYCTYNSKALFFPKANYLLNTSFDASSIFSLGAISPNFKMTGEIGATITTSLVGTTSIAMFSFFFGGDNLTIENLTFANTHGITQNQTNALQFVKGGGVPFLNTRITNCTFYGFSTAIVVQGTTNLGINNCKFPHPTGHDGAQNNTQPAVDIWGITANSGINVNAVIKNCWGEGYSGSDITATTTKRGQDGFIYGTWNGISVTDNQLSKYSVESILIAPLNPTTNTNPIVISRNTIDCKLALGANVTVPWGIRAEQSNLVITENVITNSQNGIWVYGYLSTWPFKNVVISDNTIKLGAENYRTFTPIFVQGNASFTIDNVTISSNRIIADSISIDSITTMIHVYDISNSTISDNQYTFTRVTKNGKQVNLTRLGNVVSGVTVNNQNINGTGYDSIYAFQTVGTYTNIDTVKYQRGISFTTTGSGAPTFVNNVLNIPIARSYRVATAGTSITSSDGTIRVTANTFTITAGAIVAGQVVSIINTGAGTTTISGSTFNGASSLTVSAGHGVTIQYSGTDYAIISQY